MKKLFPIALLFFIGFSQTGYHIFTVAYQLYLKEEMQEAVLHMADRKDLTCISYTDHRQEIGWEEAGKEFSFHDKMFDVAFSDTVNGRIFLYCADDSKEAALMAHYKSTAGNSSPLNKKSASQSYKIVDLFFTAPAMQAYSAFKEPFYFLKYSSIPVAGVSSIASPPPKPAFS